MCRKRISIGPSLKIVRGFNDEAEKVGFHTPAKFFQNFFAFSPPRKNYPFLVTQKLPVFYPFLVTQNTHKKPENYPFFFVKKYNLKLKICIKYI